MQDPWRSGSGPNSTFAGAAGLLQLRLLQAYLLLPKPAAFAPEHASILRLCASALKGTSAPSGDCLLGLLPANPLDDQPEKILRSILAQHKTMLHLTVFDLRFKLTEPGLVAMLWALNDCLVVHVLAFQYVQLLCT